MSIQLATTLIKQHEGYRRTLYQCTENKSTIGYGRNLEGLGISEREASYLLKNDIQRVQGELEKLIKDFPYILAPRRAALIDMCFNLGVTRFVTFRRMLKAISLKDWDTAAEEALDSKWAKQVGQRARRISLIFKEGKYEV